MNPLQRLISFLQYLVAAEDLGGQIQRRDGTACVDDAGDAHAAAATYGMRRKDKHGFWRWLLAAESLPEAAVPPPAQAPQREGLWNFLFTAESLPEATELPPARAPRRPGIFKTLFGGQVLPPPDATGAPARVPTGISLRWLLASEDLDADREAPKVAQDIDRGFGPE